MSTSSARAGLAFLALFAALGLTALALAAPGRFGLFGSGASADQVLINSKDGQPIIAADRITPGQSVTGDTEIGNGGRVAADLSLSAPAPARGALADALTLIVTDKTRAQTLYSGPLSGLPVLALGSFGPGERHSFSFQVTLPRAASPELAGQRTQLDLAWTGSFADSVPPTAPTLGANGKLTLKYKKGKKGKKGALTLSIPYKASAPMRLGTQLRFVFVPAKLKQKKGRAPGKKKQKAQKPFVVKLPSPKPVQIAAGSGALKIALAPKALKKVLAAFKKLPKAKSRLEATLTGQPATGPALKLQLQLKLKRSSVKI